MAQVMGPPLSPRETRRSSGRRSGPPLSNSHSPESDIGPRFKEASRPPLVSSNSSGSNNGRNKLEPTDDLVEDRKATGQSASASSSNSTQGSTKSKRKPKEKELESDPPQPAPLAAEMVTTDGPVAEEEEEQGITRCICGSTEDDPDAGEFMVQCETCQVWQHGLCMGFDSEDQLHDGDYYCEQCRPDMHVELLKKLARRPRHSSTTSHHTAGANSRLSRSHSPHLKQQPSKRRNTMNSRDAAFDENLKQILETTAIEAGEDPATAVLTLNDQATTGLIDFDELADPPTNRTANTNHKKRKRVENNNVVNVNDLSTTKKRTRSMSTTSDHPPTLNVNEEVPVFLPPPPPPAAAAAKPSGRNKRGGRKTAVIQDIQIDAGGDAQQPAPSKRSANSHRKGASRANARPPQSNAGGGAQVQNSISHDSRRVQGNNNNANGAQTSAADSRAYRNSHAYAVSQQPLWTSWHLPDYLSHLEEILPTNVPMPLEVVSGALLAGSGGRESVERTVERGVKVKWPSKRTSVADMNKRVRALVEWVGREQASALDRARRREALENALRENASSSVSAETQQPTSMKDMEELMEELISFQERFGPGARRERRAAAAAAS